MKKTLLLFIPFCFFINKGNCQPVTFNYTGASVAYTVPACVYTLTVDVRGAEGAVSAGGCIGGKGGRVQATLSVTPGQVLNISVGQKNISSPANASTFGGGGAGGSNGGAGGGASDIRQGGTALSNRIIVAGGGGGGAQLITSTGYWGGHGGGLVGGHGWYSNSQTDPHGGGGGTQTSGGVGGVGSVAAGNGTAGGFGIGGVGGETHAGGGGGGYYGGGGGSSYGNGGAGGGGGSSYTSSFLTGVTHTQGYQFGNGQIIITPGPATGPAAGIISGPNKLCPNGTAIYSVVNNPAITTYNWTVPPGYTINSAPGTYSVSVTANTSPGTISVTGTGSCGTSAPGTKAITIKFISVAVTPSADTLCEGDSTILMASGSCEKDTLLTLDTGTSANTSTGYPAPYGNWFWGARHQMLILASELSAGGFGAGPISSLAFNVSAVNSAPVHQGFTIGMGATAITSITSFQSGMTTVFGPVNYQPVAGWNTHVFSNPFIWDGVSNIIVETCFNNSSWVSAGNASVFRSSTSFTSTVYNYQDAAGVCASSTVISSVMMRPNMRMDGTGIDPITNYSWSPASGLNNPAAQNQTVSPATTTTYTVTGTSSSGCVATATATVTVNPAVLANAGPDVTICENGNAQLTGSGGTNYLWSTGETDATITVSPVISSTYTLVVSDANGCSGTDEVTVTVDSCIVGILSAIVSNENIFISPNPTTGKILVSFPIVIGIGFMIESIEVYNVHGKKVISHQPLENPSMTNAQMTIDLSLHPPGIYFLKVYSENGITIHKIIRE